jgi:cytochrome c-type biogenesis protein CcmH
MTFWILVGVMTLLALAFVLAPLVKPGVRRKPLLIGGLVVVITLVAVLTYQKLGTPTAAAQLAMPMPPDHPDKAMMNMDLGQLADKLAEKLKTQPENAEGWALLARTYAEVGRYKDSMSAFEKAVVLLPKDPDLMADYADVLALNNGGQFGEKAESMVDQALTIDPSHTKALLLKGTINFDRKDYAKAIESWEKVLKVPGLDAEHAKQIAANIAEAKRLLGAGA